MQQSLKNEGELSVTAAVLWKSKKELEITLRFIGTPAIIKIKPDFSKEPNVEILPIRCSL